MLLIITATQAQQSSLQLLKNYLESSNSSFKVSEQDINSLSVVSEYTDPTTNIRHIYAEQKFQGYSIPGTNYSLHTSGDRSVDGNGLLHLTDYVIKPFSLNITSSVAVGILMDAIQYQESRTLNIKQQPSGQNQYTIFSRNTSPVWDIPVRLVYFNSERLHTLIPAWEIQMMDIRKQHYWMGYIDASTGSLLERKDLIIHCNFGSGGVTDLGTEHQKNIPEYSLINPERSTTGSIILPTKKIGDIVTTGPANKYRVIDLPFESIIDPGATHSLITNPGNPLSSPDGWQKVSNGISYPYTRGNNVWAYQDPSPGPLGGVPSSDPSRTAYANNGPAGTAPPAEPFYFDYPFDQTLQPEQYRNAAIVNLFYWNNLMHDVFYYFGFTEDAANFQASPVFSTGVRSTRPSAQQDDAVQAQAQDGGGTNNANFLTLPDGTPASGQMQMYLWTASAPDSLVQITSSTTGIPPGGTKYFSVQGAFNSTYADTTNLYTHPVLNKQFVIIQKNANSTVGTSSQGCSTGQQSIALPPSNNVMDKIVLIDRGSCSFVEKVLGAQNGGARGVIVVNNVSGPPQAMGGTDAPGNAINIPAVMISKADGDVLKAQITAGATIIGSLKRNSPPAPKRDGDFDNGVMSHEYGHGISNRLTGGGSAAFPLGGAEQGGEGWSDYVALYMILRSNDLTAPTATHPFGVLPSSGIGNYVVYQPYNGLGIRPFPYSIDPAIDPVTFGYVKRSEYAETHSLGFVWASMLYDLMQAFIDIYGMNDNVYEGANPVAGNPPPSAKGNNIATRLIIEGMKLQPNNPTFVQERNAILKADTLLYNHQFSCLIWKAFAKRGLGFSAFSGTNALGDEVEAFNVPFNCDTTQRRIRIVKSGNPKINNGSLMDYTIKVTNTFPVAITGLTVRDTLAQYATFSTASDAPVVAGQIVTWTINLAGNETKTLTLRTLVNSPTASTAVFSDDQESGPGKWDSTSSYSGSNWMYKNDASQAYSGSKYWFMPDVDAGGSNASLTSRNKINISSTSELVFFHKYASEASYDGGVVEVSEDSSTWIYIPPAKFVKNGYKGVITTANNPLIGTADRAAFTGVTPGYIVSIASLDNFAGKNMYVRFRFTSDATGGSVAGGGWWIDDVFVLNNRIELPNGATARTNNTSPVVQDEGENANSSTSAFILGAAGGPLPLGLFTLSGNASSTIVNLLWSASNEQNDVRYELERKGPGEVDFHVVGTVSGTPGITQHTYQFADNNVSAGNIYLYRVKQINLDGRSFYTNIVYIRMIGKNLEVSIYPNPAKDIATVSISNPSAEQLSVMLYNVYGSKIAEFKTGGGNTQTLALPIQNLAAGTYWLEVKSKDQSVSAQLIISK